MNLRWLTSRASLADCFVPGTYLTACHQPSLLKPRPNALQATTMFWMARIVPTNALVLEHQTVVGQSRGDPGRAAHRDGRTGQRLVLGAAPGRAQAHQGTREGTRERPCTVVAVQVSRSECGSCTANEKGEVAIMHHGQASEDNSGKEGGNPPFSPIPSMFWCPHERGEQYPPFSITPSIFWCLCGHTIGHHNSCRVIILHPYKLDIYISHSCYFVCMYK